MEIQNMSAEELAKSFSNQNQNQQNQGQNQQQQVNPQEEAFNQFKVVDTQFSKSAEDIALEFSKTGKIDGKKTGRRKRPSSGFSTIRCCSIYARYDGHCIKPWYER